MDAKHLRFYGYRFLSEVTECISVQYDAYNRAMTIVVRKTLDKSILEPAAHGRGPRREVLSS